jgi:hypothetical protein
MLNLLVDVFDESLGCAYGKEEILYNGAVG